MIETVIKYSATVITTLIIAYFGYKAKVIYCQWKNNPSMKSSLDNNLNGENVDILGSIKGHEIRITKLEVESGKINDKVGSGEIVTATQTVKIDSIVDDVREMKKDIKSLLRESRE